MQKSISSKAYRKLVDWLRESRESRGWSMRDLGERIGEPHSFVQKVESMERRIDVYELVQYCKALEQDPHIAIRIVQEAS
ncbi:helix-turn-helix domain-containing protein [Saccharophagus degradans]|uniref:helix-turn-helix domain-containing protein n=1 Tax=Saccharophagus degradans TaxID=86304 RepID=UPI00059EABAF|nr:helix-turn-helix transcriptional regulator [Saccharophagus degradans]